MIDLEHNNIVGFRRAVLNGEINLHDFYKNLYEEIHKSVDDNIWIHILSLEEIYSYLESANSEGSLYGIPFSIKDNIDLKGIPSTAACPSYAKIPQKSSSVVQALLDEGAIPVGKTNMDQFATGLVGTRSPYGICKHSYHPDSISGGSSSGSAVSVAKNLCMFSLGTDTAGSGRVPAALNNIFGLKPTPGLLSMTGVIPACRSLDTVSIFAKNSADLSLLLEVVSFTDAADPMQRFSLELSKSGIPKYATIDPNCVEWKGHGDYKSHFIKTLSSLKNQGVFIDTIDLTIFFEVALMLYEGPWVAERTEAVGDFISQNLKDTDPTVAKIILGGDKLSAVNAFRAMNHLSYKKKEALSYFEEYDGIILPTIGGWFTKEEVAQDPIGVNSYLGTFTNFANLLELSATSFPTDSNKNEPTLGLTLFGPAGKDQKTLHLANELFVKCETAPIAVCGAHLEGQPLNGQLISLGATLDRKTYTSSNYRFYDLNNGKPGMVRDKNKGRSIEIEIYNLPLINWGKFVNSIPSPLGIGKVELENGDYISGFICENEFLDSANEITEFGGWRSYLDSL